MKEDRYHGSSNSSAWQNICSDTWTCDICAIPVEPPLTYHLKIAHPGEFKINGILLHTMKYT